ncbi:YdcF family protein [bacterium]|nr:YdcF family protein [bacterium]
MTYIVGKVVQFLIAPINIVLFLLVLALLCRRRAPKLSGWSLFLGVALLYVSANELTAFLFMRGLEHQYPVITSTDVPPAEAIVALGGTVYPIKYPRVEAEEISGSRMLRVSRLYHAGKAPVIVCSGGTLYKSSLGTERSEAEDIRDVLMSHQVPESALLLEKSSWNTNENAKATAKILREKGIKKIILVTSAFHMPRAVALFEREGFEVIAAPSDARAAGLGINLGIFLPSSEALRRTTLAINEYVGYYGYKLIGKL